MQEKYKAKNGECEKLKYLIDKMKKKVLLINDKISTHYSKSKKSKCAILLQGWRRRLFQFREIRRITSRSSKLGKSPFKTRKVDP
jgi:hypothetical protein